MTQTGDLLSEARPLPPAPSLSAPADQAEFALGSERTVTLAWQEVAGASRYALQVARNRLFVDNLIDVEGRTKRSATLGLRGAGSFVWRVAAISPHGLQGPWSPPLSFRVAAPREGTGSEADRIPPPLDIDEVQVYGSIVMVGGRTEPGALVAVNGEQVAVAAGHERRQPSAIGGHGFDGLAQPDRHHRVASGERRFGPGERGVGCQETFSRDTDDPAVVRAWHLWTWHPDQDWMENPTGYIVQRLRAEDDPPAEFLELAGLTDKEVHQIQAAYVASEEYCGWPSLDGKEKLRRVAPLWAAITRHSREC